MLVKYNPKRINIVWNNIQLLGYMDGTFVEIEYTEDRVTEHIGPAGDVSLVNNANLFATAMVTLIQGSPTNLQLSNLIPNAFQNSLPTGTFSMTDLNGSYTVASGPNAYLKKMTKVEFGKAITGRQWTFGIPQAVIISGVGGS